MAAGTSHCPPPAQLLPSRPLALHHRLGGVAEGQELRAGQQRGRGSGTGTGGASASQSATLPCLLHTCCFSPACRQPAVALPRTGQPPGMGCASKLPTRSVSGSQMSMSMPLLQAQGTGERGECQLVAGEVPMGCLGACGWWQSDLTLTWQWPRAPDIRPAAPPPPPQSTRAAAGGGTAQWWQARLPPDAHQLADVGGDGGVPANLQHSTHWVMPALAGHWHAGSTAPPREGK